MPNKMHHHQPIGPRCSCGNRACEVMEIVRLIAETSDNLCLLHCDGQTLQNVLLPLLEQIHTDQLSSLERWRLEQDIYRAQMASPVRPTMQWQPFSSLEEGLARYAHQAQVWYHHERQQLENRIGQREQTLHEHEAFLEECASRFVQQTLLPACVPGVAAVLQEHLERTHDRLLRMNREADAQAQRMTELHTQHQADIGRLQSGQQGTNALLAFGQREATTEWVVRNLFGLGRPQSLTLSQRTFEQLKASNHWQAHISFQHQFFRYCEQVWRASFQGGLAAKVQTLNARRQHWQTLWRHFDTNPDPGIIRTILLAPVSSH